MFTVCIDSNDDQSFTVYVEQEGEAEPSEGAAPAGPGQPPVPPEAAPESGQEEAAEPGSQTVQTVKEALTIALEALKNGGKIMDVNQEQNSFNKALGPMQG